MKTMVEIMKMIPENPDDGGGGSDNGEMTS
jgi:hypothetical protein